ncbi:MAG: glycosyltransferase family 4 protein [Lachnospiraceae bacterium]|nr:glycosyltransferase family 4 protein [Lachnospiraceae bacterium]
MKILYIANDSSVFGGANNSLIDMVYAMKELGQEPVVLTWSKNQLSDELSRHGIPCTIFHFLPCVCPIDDYPGFLLRIKMHIYNQKRVFLSRKIIRDIAPDIIHSNASNIDFGALIAKYHHIPHVWHVRELLKEGVHLCPIFPENQKKLFQKADCAIVISNFIRRNMVFSNSKTHTIFNGFSIEKYLLNKECIFSLEEGIRLLYVGVIRPQKGTMDAVLAVKELKEKYKLTRVTLKIVGSSQENYDEKLKEIIEKNDLTDNIEFYEPTNDLKPYREWADITLSCSKNEALGRVTVEGMLSGTLVIGADSGATPEIISDEETGFIYTPEDHKALAEIIYKAYSAPEKSKAIASKGREFAKETFDRIVFAKKVLEIYESVLNK